MVNLHEVACMLTSSRRREGLVSSSQPMLARFFSPPDRPRTSSLPITTGYHKHNQYYYDYSILHVLAQSWRRSISMIFSTLANFSRKLSSLGSLNNAEYCRINNRLTTLLINSWFRTYSESFPQCEIGEKDICLEDIADLATDPLAHAVSSQGDGTWGYLGVAS